MKVTIDQVLESIAQCLQVEPSAITTTTVAGDLAGWDSLAVVELVFMLERDYDLTLPPAQATTLTSVDAVLDVLRAAGRLA